MSALSDVKEIQLINSIILNAEKNGADAGGSYKNNEFGIIESMTDYLEYKNLQKQYEIKEVDISGWKVLQFVKI